MIDNTSQEAGADEINPDVSAFAKRMRARYQAREQKKAMLVNPVKQASVPPNEIRRGFTYFEQTLTDSSLTDSLTDLINQKVSFEKPYPIYGIVDGSMIRWLGDVPNHSFLMVNHPDQPSPNEYKGVHIDIHFPSDYPDYPEGFSVVVSGAQIYRSDIDRAAKYLSRNIKGHDNAMMRTYVFEDHGDIFKGVLKDYLGF